jgi:hypothetical protein
VQGALVWKKCSLRFVITHGLINQNAAVEVAAEELEPVLVEQPVGNGLGFANT